MTGCEPDDATGYLADEAATEALGARLGVLPADRVQVVHLRGDLGAGKTTLVRGLLRSMGHAGAVRSPTYTLMEPYRLGGRAILHMDLYRLGDPEELEFIGLRDALAEPVLVLVEWPERGEGVLPAADVSIRLAPSGAGRRFDAAGCGDAGRAFMDAISINKNNN